MRDFSLIWFCVCDGEQKNFFEWGVSDSFCERAFGFFSKLFFFFCVNVVVKFAPFFHNLSTEFHD
jgi:hypothetical protein